MIFQGIAALLIGVICSYFFYALLGFSSVLHSYCIALSPQSDYQEYYQAIVCGRKLSLFEGDLGFKTLGIFHILVVSGAHFNFLSEALSKVTFQKISPLVKVLFLFLFVLICGFQVTAVRAWFFFTFYTFNIRYKLFSPTPLLILLSVVTSLACYPIQIFKYSLILSWLACLGIHFGKSSLSRSFFCYTFLLPALSNIQVPSIWTIIINSFLTPVICLVLFPTAIASFFVPGLATACDFLWRQLNNFSEIISPSIEMPPTTPLIKQQILLWLLPLTINLFLIIKERK